MRGACGYSSACKGDRRKPATPSSAACGGDRLPSAPGSGAGATEKRRTSTRFAASRTGGLLDEHLPEAWDRASTRGSSLVMALVDVDYFKPYNDRYGHIAGDGCLQQVASLLVKRRDETTALRLATAAKSSRSFLQKRRWSSPSRKCSMSSIGSRRCISNMPARRSGVFRSVRDSHQRIQPVNAR